MGKVLKAMALVAAGAAAFVYFSADGREKEQAAAIKNRDMFAYSKAVFGPDTTADVKAAQFQVTSTSVPLSASTLKNGFYSDVAEFVPTILNTFEHIKSVRITTRAPFNDMRGHSTTEDAITIEFTRQTSDGISWKNIRYTNVPKLADAYWQHPALD